MQNKVNYISHTKVMAYKNVAYLSVDFESETLYLICLVVNTKGREGLETQQKPGHKKCF